MRRLTTGTFLVAVVGALAMLGLLLLSTGNDTRNAEAAFGVSDPTAGSVQNLAVDTNTAGNTATLVGSVQSCRDGLSIGNVFDIDVVVDEIAAADGVSGIGGNLVYNPAVMKVNARAAGSAHLFYQAPVLGSYFDALSDGVPDTDGDYRHDAAEIGGVGESGEGVMIRLTIEIVGAGVSALNLTDNVEFDGTPNVLDFAGSPMPVTNVIDGEIHSDGSLCPQPVDIELTSMSLTSPVSNAAGVPFLVSATSTANHVSGLSPVSQDTSITLTLPGDCTTGDPNPAVIVDASLASMSPESRNASWNVTCTNPSTHNFTASGTITETSGAAFETVLGNNTSASLVSATNILVSSDVGLTTVMGTTAAISCLPAVGPCTPLPRIVSGVASSVSAANTVTATVALPVATHGGVTLTNDFVGAFYNGNPAHPATSCTAVPDPQSGVVAAPGGPAGSYTRFFTVNCPANHSFFNPTNPAAPGPIVFVFGNSAIPADPHVSDATPAAGSSNIPLWVTQPFTPTFTATIDENDGPNDPIAPTDDDCLTNGAAFPAGIPCEMKIDTSIPTGAAFTAVGQGGQPLALALSSIPQPAFSIANGLTVPNGQEVARFGFSLTINLGAGCVVPLNVPYPATPLFEAALPANTGGFDDDGDTFVDEDGGGILGGAGILNVNDDADGETDEDGAIVWAFPEGPNQNGTVNPTDFDNPTDFNTRLLADVGVQGLVKSGALLWAHYTGQAPGVLTGVNTFVFNAGTQWLTLTVTGDPTDPSAAPNSQCTPFSTQTDYYGTTNPGGQILRQCNVVGGHLIAGAFTRADTGASSNATEAAFGSFPQTGNGVSCSPSNTSVDLTKDEIIGDDNPVGDVVHAGIEDVNTVTNTIIGSGTLTLTIAGPVACNPHWVNPLDSFPSILGGTQTSVVTIPGASGVVNADYSVTCPNGGPYNVNITSHLSPGGGEDTTDNLDENWVQIVVTCDADGDGVCTPTDNCPDVPNADQTDTDGDGLGDACDPDDDDDGIPDVTDDCDLIAEDIDGESDADGCPDTDVGVTVEKDETYDVDVSVDTLKNVEITVTNGNYPANVRVVVTAISTIGDCEVRLVDPDGAANGWIYSEYYTDEVAGPPVPDTLTSQLETVIPMAANSSLDIPLSYVIHCFQESAHADAFELQVDALPLAPVQEEDLGDDPQLPPDSASNNVHKNWPDVTAWKNADLKKVGVVVNSPATAAAGTPFVVTATSTIHNNGPVSANYSDSTQLVLPGDCTTGSPNPQVTTGTLAVSVATNVGATWNVTCTGPSNHTFTANNTLSLTGPLHHKDPNSGNNTGSGQDVTAVTAVSDSSVSIVVNAPAGPVAAGSNFVVSVVPTVNLGLATSAALTVGLSGPPDCTLTPTGGQNQVANPTVAATWNVSCSSGSNHVFNGSAAIVPTHPVHVSETNTANNTANAASAGTVVIKSVDPSCTIVTSPDGTVATLNAPGVNLVTTNNCNAGGASPAPITETVLPGTCVTTGGPGTYNHQIPAGTSCTYTIEVCIAATNIHETDTNTGNNCDQDPGTICLDTDGDGVHNGGLPCNGPDNCPNDPNPGQEDADGDGIGDVCDDTPNHDVGVKYIILVGPAAVNLSDTNGRYMWVIAEVGNFSAHDELVSVSMSIAGPVPAGCTRVETLILPGQLTFVLYQGEQKFIVWRVRYECHSPAAIQVINQTVTVAIAHLDIDGVGPHNGNDTNLSNQSKTTVKQVIID